MKRLVPTVVMLALASSCALQPGEWHGDVRAFLGDRRIERLDTATSVRALRVDGSIGAEEAALGLACGFPILREGPLLDDAQRGRFLDLVRDADSYRFDVAKACEFMPGVALRFDGPAGALDVLLCFSCDEWAFATATPDGQLADWVVEDDDDVRPALLGLARELFPDDEALAALR